MKIEEFIVREEARGDGYRLLAACFYPPKKAVLIEEKLFENLASAMRGLSPEAASRALEMDQAARRCSDKDLAVEYARLFVGPFGLQAAPYGSIYLDDGRRTMGDSTMEVQKAYREAGLSLDKDFKELPDHVAAELEFLHFLIFKEVEALRGGDMKGAMAALERQDSFLTKYLKPFAAPFAEALEKGTRNGFYKALAGCLRDFVGGDRVTEDLTRELAASLS